LTNPSTLAGRIYGSRVSIKRRLGQSTNPVLDRALRPRGEKRFQDEFAKASADGSVRINLGSGGQPLAGWLNTDVVWRGRVYLDATSPWPVPAGSVDYVYADNVIEHITLGDGRKVFRHAFDALRPGGVFRLATPDVEAVARQYLENGELAQLGLQRNRERGRDFRYPVELLRQVYVGAQHYLGFCYDWESISTEMGEAGFVAKRCAAGRSDHAELVDLEARLHPAEEATSLIVEGHKPV